MRDIYYCYYNCKCNAIQCKTLKSTWCHHTVPDAAHDGGRVVSPNFNRKALQQVGGSMLITLFPSSSKNILHFGPMTPDVSMASGTKR